MAANKVKVDQRSRRSDDDALEGHFVTVVEGEHAGVYGTFDRVLEHGKDGYPKTILFVPRHAPQSPVTVDYSNVRPARQERR